MVGGNSDAQNHVAKSNHRKKEGRRSPRASPRSGDGAGSGAWGAPRAGSQILTSARGEPQCGPSSTGAACMYPDARTSRTPVGGDGKDAHLLHVQTPAQRAWHNERETCRRRRAQHPDPCCPRGLRSAPEPVEHDGKTSCATPIQRHTARTSLTLMKVKEVSSCTASEAEGNHTADAVSIICSSLSEVPCCPVPH